MAVKSRNPVRALSAILIAVGLAWPGLSCGVIQPGASPPLAAEVPSDELVERFQAEGILWIRAERERHYSRAVPIPERDLVWLAEYFPADLLDRARVAIVEGFENPEFFSLFEEYGELRPFDLRRASGMALVDTIVLARNASESSTRDRLLFHELVHLMQYEVLGLEEYMKGYVEGWAESGRSYRGIPHEQQAFELSSRFWRSRGTGFSVQSAVLSRFDLNEPGGAHEGIVDLGLLDSQISK